MTQKPAEILKQFPFIYSQIVAWGDMDALGHVNNIMYYRYAESARIDYLRALDEFADKFLVLAQSSCNYLRPVHFPDTIKIGVRAKKVGNTSLISEYVFFSESQQEVVATAETVMVQMTADGSAKESWSEIQKQKISDLESTTIAKPL